MSTHIVPIRTYLLVFAALVLLTLATVEVSRLDLGPLNTIVALVVAAAKTALVVLIFMHVRYSGGLVWLAIFCGVLWLALLIGLTMTDFFSRAWLGVPKGF